MEQNNLPIALFNGTVCTTNGLYSVKDIDIDTAKKLIDKNGFISAIGHEATAEIMSQLMEQNIPMNRIQFHQQVGQIAIVFKLKERPKEGHILTKEELERVGYSLKIMERLE
ncbi:YddF family protein [Alkalicella caledoniensis]|uniref:YddF family protein n=1 Tax=Alkalicella caledoniensis TaxID=2731377 RepID=A0A7G9W9D1_ALKCA|nr:YddF family protein [Alkalicella caledoniensis]QNO15293.1 YddF family protein [Alkalicella caledoniensis]